MLPIIVGFLLALGVISSPESYQNLEEQERQQLLEQHDFVVQDELSW